MTLILYFERWYPTRVLKPDPSNTTPPPEKLIPEPEKLTPEPRLRLFFL